ncbi:type II secretion system protein [Prochlorococcus sp. MIT 1304]|uniref:type II secretion system protein n=1 Tax=unclassified Prochlorococcus TaxID=2627481 RepID=UPI0039B430EA
MVKSFFVRALSPKIRFEKIKNLTSLRELKDEEGFTLVELIVVVMMIGILSSIAIPQFMTAADKAKQKEATGIVAALVKAATAFQTEYGDLPTDAGDIEEYARFQRCNQTGMETEGGKVCKGTDPVEVPGTATSFYSTSGNYLIEFQTADVNRDTVFQVRAQPNGGAYANNGSAVTGCYNPVDATSKVYEKTAKAADRGRLTDWSDAEC